MSTISRARCPPDSVGGLKTTRPQARDAHLETRPKQEYPHNHRTAAEQEGRDACTRCTAEQAATRPNSAQKPKRHPKEYDVIECVASYAPPKDHQQITSCTDMTTRGKGDKVPARTQQGLAIDVSQDLDGFTNGCVGQVRRSAGAVSPLTVREK